MTESEAIKELRENIDLPFGSNISKEASGLAIQALEKQIPKKPMMAYDDKIDSNWVSCPICANGIGLKLRARKIKFCWDCGQRLDFGDDEK